DRGPARVDAGGDDHLVEAVNVGVACGVIQAHLGAGAAQALGVVGDRLGEFLLAGDLLRQVELAAELAGALEQRYRVATLRGDRGGGQAGRAAADDSNFLFLGSTNKGQFRFAPRTRIDHAARRLADEVVVEARLVARDADVDAGSVAG